MRRRLDAAPAGPREPALINMWETVGDQLEPASSHHGPIAHPFRIQPVGTASPECEMPMHRYQNVISCTGVEAVPVSNADMVGTQLTYHLLNAELSGTSGVVADYVVLPP